MPPVPQSLPQILPFSFQLPPVLCMLTVQGLSTTSYNLLLFS